MAIPPIRTMAGDRRKTRRGNAPKGAAKKTTPPPIVVPESVTHSLRGDYLDLIKEGVDAAGALKTITEVQSNMSAEELAADARAAENAKTPRDDIKAVRVEDGLRRLEKANSAPSKSKRPPVLAPEHCASIRDFVERMIAGETGYGRLLKAEIFEERGVTPFEVAMSGIKVALHRAGGAETEESDIVAAQKYAGRQRARAIRLAHDLSAFLREFNASGFAPTTERGIARMNFAAANEARAAARAARDLCLPAVKGLRTLAKLGRIERNRLEPLDPRKNPNVWAKAFAEQLGLTWRGLTGNDPLPRERSFPCFVAAAYLSVAAKGNYRWVEQGRDTIGRVAGRAPWDQFKRHFDETNPGEFDTPGTLFKTPAQVEEDLDRAACAHEEDLRDLAEMAASSDLQRRATGLIALSLEHERSGPEIRALIESLCPEIVHLRDAAAAKKLK
jgi:hypothetical protein